MATVPHVSGSVVVITGAARGIGFATAELLAKRSAKVAICDIDSDEVSRAAAQIGAGAHEAFDVTDGARLAAFLDDVEERLGPIDVLVNNAAICPAGSFLDESDDVTARTIAVNLTAVIVGTRLAVSRMRPRRRGHVINVSSLGGVIAQPGVATYCGTKHGVIGFTDAARMELRGTGITVSTVLPAVTQTRMIDGLGRAFGVTRSDPSAVADVILSLIENPAPRRIVGRLLALSIGVSDRILSRRANENLRRATGADQVFFTRLDAARRGAYEAAIRSR